MGTIRRGEVLKDESREATLHGIAPKLVPSMTVAGQRIDR